MALQMSLTTSSGLRVRDAYIRIDEYSCNRSNVVSARLRAYATKEFAEHGMSAVEEWVVSLTADYSTDAPNTKKQIYDHAKTLPEFELADDYIAVDGL
ncbi:hypothetical protein [Shouchella clausii]|uniref:hypothetical protein n=1 Tax=Shouchella clausii TaxID=79880 RepID=UPI001652ECDD|nr:hypothetical protein [Shouchella clausii]QNM43758.1 hypothetical protein DUT88_13010 [Shouchella clausii]